MRQHNPSGRVALGFRAHSGWAAMVALRDPVAAPLVVQRRRLELMDRGGSCPAQPYHAAQEMALNDAETFLQECAETAEALAIKAVRDAVAGLAAYQFKDDGRRISGDFTATVDKGFAADGTIREKYNVDAANSDVKVAVGYKTNVVGFGWTNAVYLKIAALTAEK